MNHLRHTPKLLILLLVFFAASSAYGQCIGDNTFTGTDGDWNTASNWSANCVPSGAITGIITIEANCQGNLDAVTYSTTGKLVLAEGITLTNTTTDPWTLTGFEGEGTYKGDVVLFTGAVKPGTCNPFVYEGQTYKTVQIGNQCWMAENLNVGTVTPVGDDQTDNGTIEKYCNNCDTYGGLYQWNEMMNYTPTESTQGICPSGWHIPSDGEWKELEMALGMSQGEANDTGWRGTNEGSQMAGNADLWSNGSLEQDPEFNSSGLVVLPAGYRYDGSFDGQATGAYLWSSTQGGGSAWYRSLYYYNTDVYRLSSGKSIGISVRCVRD